jgi:cathepsin B
MFKSVLFVALLGLSMSGAFGFKRLNTRYEELVNAVNDAHTTWTAGVNGRFAYDDINEVKAYLGALKAPAELKLPIVLHNVNAVPDAFDARTQWGSICPTISEIRDQSACGSCWAFGAVEAASDRACISTNGAVQLHLSATDLLSCCGSCGFGCSGGYPESAWNYFKTTGVVTGGNYGDYSLCSSYPFPQCDHHVTGKYGPCPSTEYNTPACPKSCDTKSTYNVTFTADKHKFASAYSVATNVAQIQTEILTNGPVEGAFTVYEDFVTYTSGVYQHTTGSELGGHAIKILGWGTLNGTPYWTVANSWNEGWGNQGYFLILRGKDECGIEDGIVAGLFK